MLLSKPQGMRALAARCEPQHTPRQATDTALLPQGGMPQDTPRLSHKTKQESTIQSIVPEACRPAQETSYTHTYLLLKWCLSGAQNNAAATALCDGWRADRMRPHALVVLLLLLVLQPAVWAAAVSDGSLWQAARQAPVVCHAVASHEAMHTFHLACIYATLVCQTSQQPHQKPLFDQMPPQPTNQSSVNQTHGHTHSPGTLHGAIKQAKCAWRHEGSCSPADTCRGPCRQAVVVGRPLHTAGPPALLLTKRAYNCRTDMRLHAVLQH